MKNSFDLAAKYPHQTVAQAELKRKSIPLRPELLAFANEIIQRLAGVKFIPTRGSSSGKIPNEHGGYDSAAYEDGYANTAYVYVEGDEYIRGVISWADYRQTAGNVDIKPQFCVHAPTVTNQKTDRWSNPDLFYRRGFLKIPRAAKEACKVFQEYPKVIELWLAHEKYKSAFNSKDMEFTRTVRTKLETSCGAYVSIPPKLINELYLLHSTGHEFLHMPEVPELLQAVDEMKKLRADTHMYFVRGTHDNKFVLCDSTSIDLEHKKTDWDNVIKNESNFDLTTVDNLPQHVEGKLAVLLAAEDETLLNGVGYRVDPNTFFIIGDRLDGVDTGGF